MTRMAVHTHRLLMWVVFVLLTFYFAVYVVYAVNLTRFPFDYDQGEGFELHDAVLFSQGKLPYADIETYPFYGSIYPPLYHILLVPFVWIFGPAYWYGRLFSFLTTLVTASAIGYAVYRESEPPSPTLPPKSGEGRKTGDDWLSRSGRKSQWIIPIFAGLAFLSSPIVYHIGPLFRQHIPMFMFETLAVVTLAHVNEIEDPRKRRRQLSIGLGLLVAAGYTKQLAAFTAVAALAFLFIRCPRRAVVWGAGFAIVGVAIFAGLTLITDGHWWTQTITANVKDFYPEQATGLFKVFLRQHGWLLIPAAWTILHDLYCSRISIYSLWFVSTLLLNAMAAGTWGAGDSYYATSIAALCVLSGIFVARTLNGTWTFYENVVYRALVGARRAVNPSLALPIDGEETDRAAGQVPVRESIRKSTHVYSVMMVVIPLLYLAYGRAVLHMPTKGAGFAQIADALNIEDNTGYGFHDPDGYTTLAYAQIGHLTTRADIDAGYAIVDLIKQIPPDVPILSEEAAFSFHTNRDVITNPVVLYILDQVGHYDSSALVSMIESQQFGLIVLRARFYPVPVNVAITTYYEELAHVQMNGFDYVVMRPKSSVQS